MDPQITLRIYQTRSGEWAGTVLFGDVEVGGIAGCKSASEVEEAAADAGHTVDVVETV